MISGLVLFGSSNNMNKKLHFIFFISIVIIDQLSKYFMLNHVNNLVDICQFLRLNVCINYGTSFGLFTPKSALSNILLISFITSLIVVLICVCYKTKNSIQKLLITCIIGGAISNLIDRFVHKGVIDFIEVHYNEFYYPVFNIADSIICICAICLLLLNYKK